MFPRCYHWFPGTLAPSVRVAAQIVQPSVPVNEGFVLDPDEAILCDLGAIMSVSITTYDIN